MNYIIHRVCSIFFYVFFILAFMELLHIKDDHRKLFYAFCDLAIAGVLLAIILKRKR